MKSIFFSLALVGVAIADSSSSAAASSAYSSSSAAPSSSYGASASSYAASSSPSYGSSAPAYTGSSSSYQAPPSQYTSPPAQSGDGYLNQMPYSTFLQGGYKSLNCGYGYKKDQGQACTPASWVAIYSILLVLHSNRRHSGHGLRASATRSRSMFLRKVLVQIDD
jgi:hypothetical protein